ncbi:MAG: PhoU domain-containing protein [Planctomycetota bacterium]
MPTTTDAFISQAGELKGELIAQGRRVLALVEASFDAVFSGERARAQAVAKSDDEIDTADVAIEKACVQLLTDATAGDGIVGATLGSDRLREVLMLAKINNELERIADAGVDVAELVVEGDSGGGAGAGGGAGGGGANVGTTRMGRGGCPDTFMVMANSVIGILRDTNHAVARNDAAMAKVVLQSQHAVTAFKRAILKDAEQKIARGTMSVDFAFRLHEIASQCELIADHCTNIAEQVIYQTTGAIVRHMEHRWVEIPTAKP